MIRILQRYILTEVVRIFVLALEEKFHGWEVGLGDVLDFNQAPVAKITKQRIGSIYRLGFEANAIDLDGEIRWYSWEFGDGNESSSRDPEHEYAVGGSYA